MMLRRSAEALLCSNRLIPWITPSLKAVSPAASSSAIRAVSASMSVVKPGDCLHRVAEGDQRDEVTRALLGNEIGGGGLGRLHRGTFHRT